MTNTNFTEKEIQTIKQLIRLGDSKELAENTVINLREKKSNVAFYDFAYRS